MNGISFHAIDYILDVICVNLLKFRSLISDGRQSKYITLIDEVMLLTTQIFIEVFYCFFKGQAKLMCDANRKNPGNISIINLINNDSFKTLYLSLKKKKNFFLDI